MRIPLLGLALVLTAACSSPTAPREPVSATLQRAGVTAINQTPLVWRTSGGTHTCISCKWSCCTM